MVEGVLVLVTTCSKVVLNELSIFVSVVLNFFFNINFGLGRFKYKFFEMSVFVARRSSASARAANVRSFATNMSRNIFK